MPKSKKSDFYRFTRFHISWQFFYWKEMKNLEKTSMLLLTTTNFVHGATLSKCLVLCFRQDYKKFILLVFQKPFLYTKNRLHQSADHQVNHTASAILRQSIGQVFDRVNVSTPQGNSLIFEQNQAEPVLGKFIVTIQHHFLSRSLANE